MAGVTFDKVRNQWKVSWYRAPYARTSSRFDTEAEARAFVPPNESRRSKPGGPGSAPRSLAEVMEVLAASVQVADDGCHLWTGALTTAGYGRLTWTTDTGSIERGAHRVSYRAHVGPIPSGLDLDHLCRNRACINPDHLEPVTRRENLMRSPIAPAAINAAKTHCPQGHEYNEANTIRQRNGGRLCRTCQNSRSNRKSVSA